MQIADMGYEITGVPGLFKITVEPSEHSPHGVRIVLHETDPDDDPRVPVRAPRMYGLDELQEYFEALQRAHTLGQRMAADQQDRF